MASGWDVRRGPVILTSSVALSSVVTGLVGIAIPRLLSPGLFGQFQFAQLIWQFGLFANVGVPWAVQRVIARAPDGDDGDRALETAATFLSVLSLLWFPTLGAAAIMGRLPLSPGVATLVAAALATRQAYALLQGAVVARGRFAAAGQVDIAASVLNLLLTVVLTRRAGLAGLMVAQTAWAAVASAGLVSVGGLRLRPRFDGAAVVALVRAGWPYAISGALQTALKNTGRLAVAIIGTTVMLGYFGLAVLLLGYAEIVGTAMSKALLRTISQPGAVGDAARGRRAYMLQAVAYVSVASAAIGAVGALAAPGLVAWLLPQYGGGVEALQIVALILPVIAWRYTVEPLLYALDMIPTTYGLQLASVVAGGAVAATAMATTRSLAWAAVAASVGYALTGGGFLWRAASALALDAPERRRFFNRALGPPVAGALAVAAGAAASAPVLGGALALLVLGATAARYVRDARPSPLNAATPVARDG